MTTVLNFFSNLGESNKKNVTTGSGYHKKSKSGSLAQTPSSFQAQKFKKYQKNISNSVNKNAKKLSEGFQTYDNASQSNSVLQETDISSQKQTVANLKTQYDSTLNEYNTLIQQIQGKATGYLDRVSPNNPYLNKTVRFTTGHIAYVTNKGVVKYVPTMEIWSSTGIPTDYIDLGIPWDDSYSTQGTTIATTPPLISGTFLELNQSVGNEGSNVFVDKYLSDTVAATAIYQGCYADDTSSPLMTFIGDAPVQPSALLNGDFSQPQLANDSYQYITTSNSAVPGWYFDAVLVNNSSAWGYPMPYPSGSQAASIQGVQALSQTMDLQSGVKYTLSFDACGRPGYSGANQIDIMLDIIQDQLPSVSIYSFTPPLVWTKYSTTFTVSSSVNYALGFLGKIDSIYNSTAIQNIHLTGGGSSSAGGSYTYDQCKNSATAQGYQYFALQNVNTSNSQGYCAASNSQPTVTSLGESMTVTGQVALWASNTSGQPGNTATLTTTGSLSVLNSGGQSVFSTDNSSAPQGGSYIGCYGDTGDRAMPNTSNNQYLSFDDCKNLGASYKYFATQNASNGMGWCAASNDLATATKYGQTSSCSKYGDNWMGSGWSNAIYSSGPDGSYFLSVQGDGNVCVYRGTSPSDNQGGVWCSGTNGKGQSPNPAYAAANGKYGKDWIASGSTLAAGDFVGSSDGTFALIMQSDGNLVLYTYTLGSNCQKMADGNTGAGPGGNALYGFNKTSIPGNMGKLAYVDENSQLYAYPSDNVQLVNTYSKFPEIDSGGHDIPGAAYGNATVDQCTTTCDNNSTCAGFAFYQNTCYPKDNTMFPVPGTSQPLKGCDVYIKNRQPKTPPTGVPKTTNNTDTVTYQNYLPGSGQISKQYGLSSATSVQKQQLSDLETRLNLITSEINKYTNLFENNGSLIDNQTNQNIKDSKKYVKDITKTNKQITLFSTNMDRILDDSDIVVLQKNYDYLFWSILATGIVLISMNIVKKN
jgi:hypothetical protein